MKTNRRESKRGNDKGAIGVVVYNRLTQISGKAQRRAALTLFWCLVVPGYALIAFAWLLCGIFLMAPMIAWFEGTGPIFGWWERPASVAWASPLLAWAVIRCRKNYKDSQRKKETIRRKEEAIADAERRRREERRRIEAQQRIAAKRRAQAREEAAKREREAAAECERQARRATMTTHPEEALSRIQQWDPYDVEKVIAALLRVTPGYRHVNVTPPGADGGIDIRATFTDGHGVKRPVGVQVKRQIKDVGGPLVRNLRGSLQAKAKGMFFPPAVSTRERLRKQSRATSPAA